MPTGCAIYVHLPARLTDDKLVALRQRLVEETQLSEWDFYRDGPLVPDDEWPAPIKEGRWYNANLVRAFYSPDYPRGDLPTILRVAEWLETNLPDGEVWYGNDCADESIERFSPESRAALLQHWRTLNKPP